MSGARATDVDVAIVGLGPTGAVLANLCGLHGLRTVVHERSPDPYPVPRACHLDAEIARVLQQCGFETSLHRLLTVSAGMEYVDRSGRRLFTFEGFEREPLLGWHEDYVFVQPELDAMVRGGLERFRHVSVHLGSEAPSVDELLERAAFVVAADGASSSVRRQLGIGLVEPPPEQSGPSGRERPQGYDQEWLVLDVSLEPGRGEHLPSIIQQVCDPERLVTFVPSHGRHRRWEVRIAPGEQIDPWTFLAGWEITPTDATLVRAATYRFHALVAAKWRGGPGGRVLLAGDAAHQMPPFMGQGMCSGIRDAANLAWKLADVVHARVDPSLLDTYETERRGHAEAVIGLSVQAGRLLGDLADDLAANRPLRLPEPDRADPMRWSRLPGLDLGGAFPVGHQVPQPDRLDDRLGLGWAVVTAAADVAADLAGLPAAAVVVEPRATYGHRALLVRPDRYVAAVLA